MKQATAPGVWMQITDRDLLRRLIKLRGIQHRQLARAVGWKSHGMIGHLLDGRKNSVAPEKAVALAYALSVPVDVLFVTKSSSETVTAVQPGRKKRAA